MEIGGKRFHAQRSPESQTLIVLSQLPDTTVFPSGEKATEVMCLLWALVFSVTRLSVAARGKGSQLKEGSERFRLNARLNPRL